MRIGILTWGTDGDVQPFLALGHGLSRAGHQVTLAYASADGRDYADRARELGLQSVCVARLDQGMDEAMASLRRATHPVSQARIINRSFFEPALEPMLDAARQLCAESDLAVAHSFAHPMKTAAEASLTPFCAVTLQPDTLPSDREAPTGMPRLGRLGNRLSWRVAGWVVNRLFLSGVNRQRSALGLAPSPGMYGHAWESERLTLIAASRLFARPGSDWSASRKVCGHLRPPDDAEGTLSVELRSFLGAAGQEDAPVYFTFGSMIATEQEQRSVLEIWTRAAELAGVRAVFQLPFPDRTPAPRSEGMLHVGRTPHPLVLPRCSAVVHHASLGMTHAACLAGRPSVCVTTLTDQYYWAAELRRAGLAPKPLERRGLSAQALARALSRVPELAPAAREASMVLRHEDGVTSAVGLIEEMMAAR